ncbi:MAG: hypothetical protein K0B87_07895 [Candidatus Syntrophosphaera sp.]|nr:hypothetical protein [Candidatus Syntrophosphaera sp.]
MNPLSEPRPSLLAAQNFYLRLLILALAFIGALEASLRTVAALIALFLFFLLLDLTLYPRLFRALRLSLPWFAAYWIFATLFATRFPDMALFTLRLLFFIVATVYCFGNLNLRAVLRDTAGLRRHKWGERLVRYLLATALFIRAYARHFARHKPKGSSSLGSVLDSMLIAGRQVYSRSATVEAQLERAVRSQTAPPEAFSANVIALCLLALMVLITAF